MKLRNILLSGLSVLALASCSDYLDVDAPSKIFPEEVYTDKRQMGNALNGVYASMLTGDTYGKAFLKELCFNTDVDFAMNQDRYFSGTAYRRYEADPDGSHIKKAWDALYKGIERANMFIYGVQESELYNEEDKELMQMLGEAMVLRAIFYHDLIWYFGDVPYSRIPSYKNPSNIYDVADRTVILDDMINDLIWIEDKMQLSSDQGFTDGVERISREMAWSMIARLALTAGGYSLRPEGGGYGIMKRPENYKVTVNGETKTYNWTDFYETAKTYADKVINESQHNLTKDFYEVFVDECNFRTNVGDDVIWEIPFGKESTGSIGYIHGPKMDNTQGSTPHAWGKADASAQLNAHYRYMFDEDDSRRNFVNQLFGYNNQGVPQYNNGRTVYNGKWSKLWNENGLGAATEDNTGFNFPYMRYADVLLMYAEAVNELEDGVSGPNGSRAIEAYETVRGRAFRNNAIKARYRGDNSHDDFLKAVLDERKFEFAGENMRWRDLVRNNKLNEVVYWTFQRYYNTALSNTHYSDQISAYDFGADAPDWQARFVESMRYHNDYPDGTLVDPESRYTIPFCDFPQKSPNVKIVWVINPYDPKNTAVTYKTRDKNADGKIVTTTHQPGTANTEWINNDNGKPTDYFLYSLRGYIYQDEDEGHITILRNGSEEEAPTPDSNPTYETLPTIRYILPYPRSVITRSMGKYENKYGYR